MLSFTKITKWLYYYGTERVVYNQDLTKGMDWSNSYTHVSTFTQLYHQCNSNYKIIIYNHCADSEPRTTKLTWERTLLVDASIFSIAGSFVRCKYHSLTILYKNMNPMMPNDTTTTMIITGTSDCDCVSALGETTIIDAP